MSNVKTNCDFGDVSTAECEDLLIILQASPARISDLEETIGVYKNKVYFWNCNERYFYEGTLGE